MEDKRTFLSFLLRSIIVLLLIFVPYLACSETGSLSADSIKYNVHTKLMEANGNVVIKKSGAILRGDTAFGVSDSSEMTLKGNVSVNFPKNGVTVTAFTLTWKPDRTKKSRGMAEASGNVHIRSTNGGRLYAETVTWQLGTENYSAAGGVNGSFDGHIIQAERVTRHGKTFSSVKVKRYENVKQKVGIASAKIDGEISGREVIEFTAEGPVRIDYIDKEGLKTVITAQKGIYSKARGTFVLSGGTKSIRSDGKSITADTLVLHEDTKNIEAIGNSKITFVFVAPPDKKGGEKK